MEKLINLLQECETQLATVHEQHWRYEISSIVKKLESTNDRYFLEQILTWYEGIDSFSDLILTNDNGHTLECDAEIDLNNTFEDLRSDIYDEVQNLLI